MAYVLLARWVAKQGEEENVRAALERLAGPTREEPGCLMWQPHRDPDDPRVFLIYEQYRDKEALDAHGSS
ncbi:MAG TPA: putative quinol monooxygenase, partial [Gaiellaceae bacterium]|nr:putative quinol monooxygenase [Gaiellaceae bacterium]